MKSTVFETFKNISEFDKKTANQSVYISLSNGWYIPVTKKAIKLVAKSMKRENLEFVGDITYLQNNIVQVKLY